VVRVAFRQELKALSYLPAEAYVTTSTWPERDCGEDCELRLSSTCSLRKGKCSPIR
jgi:hypothetical protein